MISWARVLELRDEVGSEDFDEVVELFLEEVEDVLDRLKQGASENDLANDMHFLKGSAMSLGFQGFSNKCRDAERLSAEGQPNAVDLPGIFQEYEQSKAQFVAELPGHIAG